MPKHKVQLSLEYLLSEYTWIPAFLNTPDHFLSSITLNTNTAPPPPPSLHQSGSCKQASEANHALPWQSAKPCPASFAACVISCPPCVTKSVLWCSSGGPAIKQTTNQHSNDYSTEQTEFSIESYKCSSPTLPPPKNQHHTHTKITPPQAKQQQKQNQQQQEETKKKFKISENE